MMKTLLLPPAMAHGDTIGIASPSWCGAGLFPHRLEAAKRQMEVMGYKVKVATHACGINGWTSGTPQERADDLHELFSSPEVRAIVCAIGGDHANQVLPLLDFDLIRDNPRIFMGFSDISVLNIAIWQRCRLVTFNGPMALTDFAENPAMLPYTRQQMERVLCQQHPAGVIPPSTAWTEEFLDWVEKKDTERERRMQPFAGWKWLKPGHGEGRLLGGCLESLQHLQGTPFWPDFHGAILFLETSEEAPPPETVDSLLMDYENMGIFDRIHGLLFGRPMRYSDEQKQQLQEVILERTCKFHFPVVTEMDFGHTAPQMTLPIGCLARIDSQRQVFEILQAAVQSYN